MDARTLSHYLHRMGIQRVREINNNLQALCPFHDEKERSWGISIDEPHYHGCFACGAVGTLFTLLVRIGKYSYDEAKKICKIHEGQQKFEEFEPEKKERVIDVSELYPYRLSKKARAYLASRGIHPRLVKPLEIVYKPTDRRILFPWYYKNKLVGVTGRTIDPHDGIKTLPYFGTFKADMLYLPNRQITSGRFYLVEGELDAVKVFTCGQKNVGALCHGRLSEGVIKLVLKSDADEICSFTDDDKAGARLTAAIFSAFSGKKKLSRFDYTHLRRTLHRQGSEKLDPAEIPSWILRKEIRKRIVTNADWQDF